MLLEVWGEKIADLRGTRKNSHVYAEMADQLQKSGVDVDADGVRLKTKNFTAKYRYKNRFICFAFFPLFTFPLSERKNYSWAQAEDPRRSGAILHKSMKFWAVLRPKMSNIWWKKAWDVSKENVIFYFLIIKHFLFFKLFHQCPQHQQIQDY